VTSRSSKANDRDTTANPKNARATVTGVDSAGQLFRDSVLIASLKGQKCTYQASVKPSLDSSVMFEMRTGSETWRCNAKIRGVSAAKSGQQGFRVTVELDHAQSVVIEPADEEPAAPAKNAAAVAEPPLPFQPPAPAPVEPPEDDEPFEELEVPFVGQGQEQEREREQEQLREQERLQQLEQAAKPPDFGSAPDFPADSKPASLELPTALVIDVVQSLMASEVEQWKRQVQEALTAQADIVRSLMASEAEHWKRDVRKAVAGQVEAAIEMPLARIESRLEQRLRNQRILTEDDARKIAERVAEDAQIEWGTTSQKIVAETTIATVTSEIDQLRQELRRFVSAEIEGALRGRFAVRMTTEVNKAVDAVFREQQSRKKPPVTEDAVRKIATQIAEDIQLEWVSTQLQKMVGEAVRSALSSELRTQVSKAVAGEIEAAARGPLAARMSADVDKALEAKLARYFKTPDGIASLRKLVEDALRQAIAS